MRRLQQIKKAGQRGTWPLHRVKLAKKTKNRLDGDVILYDKSTYLFQIFNQKIKVSLKKRTCIFLFVPRRGPMGTPCTIPIPPSITSIKTKFVKLTTSLQTYRN